MLSASCLWQIPGWCDEARNVINCSNILEAAKNSINWSLFVGIPQIFIAALYQVLIPLENCLKPKQFVFKWYSKYIWNTFETDKNAKSNTMTENTYFSWQEMPAVRIWQISISPLRMFWQPSHLSCTFLLKTFGAITNSSDFRCQMKILQVLFSPQFGTFYACARWKRQMLCKNNISFSFLCQLALCCRKVFWWRRGDKFIFLDCSNFALCRRLLYLYHFLLDKSCLLFLAHSWYYG